MPKKQIVLKILLLHFLILHEPKAPRRMSQQKP